MNAAAVPMIGKPTVFSIVQTGFDSIRFEMIKNYERKEPTDVAQLLEKLRATIMDETGYDYPVLALMEVFDLWLPLNGKVQC